MDSWALIARRLKLAHKLRDPLYGGPTPFDVGVVKRERFRWARLFKWFCGSLIYTDDELIALAHRYAQEHGVCTERGDIHDFALIKRFSGWIWKLPDMPARRKVAFERIRQWNRTPEAKARKRLAEINAKILAARPKQTPEQKRQKNAAGCRAYRQRHPESCVRAALAKRRKRAATA